MKNQILTHRLRWVTWSSLICLLLFLTGCGGSGVERVAVSGNVTLDGKPLEEGVIVFVPQGEGPSAGGEIVQGKYSFTQENGPSPGDYRVEIRAYRGTGKQIRDEASGTVQEETVSSIPARYNAQSSLAAKVESAGPNQFDFQLTSR